jgi:hypothetical protein
MGAVAPTGEVTFGRIIKLRVVNFGLLMLRCEVGMLRCGGEMLGCGVVTLICGRGMLMLICGMLTDPALAAPGSPNANVPTIAK